MIFKSLAKNKKIKIREEKHVNEQAYSLALVEIALFYTF